MKTLGDPSHQDELLHRLRALRPDSARRWGRMSVHQMVCHVADAYRMGYGGLRASDASNWLDRTVVKWVALRAPMPWPRGIPTRPEVDALAGGTKPTEFTTDVQSAVSEMERFVACRSVLARVRHPVFGAMSNDDWLRWGYLHADHHLRQFGA